MTRIVFTEQAWDDYIYWQSVDKKLIKRINKLIADIERNGYSGIGKPEFFKNELSGYASRCIDDKHRLVYKIEGELICIYQCRGHYE